MGSPEKKRVHWLSVPPPVHPPGAGDMTHLRSKSVGEASGAKAPGGPAPPPITETSITSSAKGSIGAPGSGVGSGASAGGRSRKPTPPPVWHPSIDPFGKPRSIARGRMLARKNARIASDTLSGTSSAAREFRPTHTTAATSSGSRPGQFRSPPHTRRQSSTPSAEGWRKFERSDSRGMMTSPPRISPPAGMGIGAPKPVERSTSPLDLPPDNWEVGAHAPPQHFMTGPKADTAWPSPVLPSNPYYSSPSPAHIATRRRILAKQNDLSGLSNHYEDIGDQGHWETLTEKCGQWWEAFGDWNNRRMLKHVVASMHVLRTYHDSYLQGTIPISMQARAYLRSGTIGMLWTILEFVLAILSGCLYIYSTYVPAARRNWCFRFQNTISVLFLCDYVLRVYTEPVRLYYVWSMRGFTDLLSVIPVFLFFGRANFDGEFLRLLQFVRVIRIFDLINKLHIIGTSVTQQILLLALATFGAILFDAGVIQWVETYTAPRDVRSKCPEEGCMSFWHAFYFLIVTVGTVGFGDFTAKTIGGQAVVCLTIVCALICLPLQVRKIHALAAKRPYGGSFSNQKIVGSRFLILTGSITFPGVRSFLAEFYKPTHRQDLEIYPLRVAILGPFVPSFDFKQLLSYYGGSAEFIEGSPVLQSDLERVSAHRAMAIFLLADSDAENWKVEDSGQIVRALAIHRFCTANRESGYSRIIVEVLDPDTQRSAVWDELHSGYVEVICPARVHYKMMARSCFVRGLYTLIVNLFTSELRLKYVQKKHYLTEYFHSSDNEVYPVILPPVFHGLPFEEAAEMIFVTFSGTLIGLDTEIITRATGKKSRQFLLFPKERVICHDDVGMVITTDLSIAFDIASYRSWEDRRGIQAALRECWEGLVEPDRVDMMRTNEEGILLLDPVSNEWQRTSWMLGNAMDFQRLSAKPTDFFGVKGQDVFPTGPDTEYLTEKELRSAIQGVYTTESYPGWRDRSSLRGEFQFQTPSAQVEGQDDDSESDSSNEQHGLRFEAGLALEQASDRLLAWPPLSKHERPHPAVLELRKTLILSNLDARRISMVVFNRPHILVCCQAGWPANLFYFLSEHRKPNFPNPPIVILYPHSPTAQQWGSVGVFEDVFFMKGSPVYELDLMRAGVLQAVKVVILADQGLPVDLGGVGLSDSHRYIKRPPAAYTSDVENIVVSANVQRLYGNSAAGVTLVEMQHAEGFHYLKPRSKISLKSFFKEDLQRNKHALVHFGPPFMEGRAVSSTMLGFLLRSTFYNKNTMSIVEQLVQGGFVATADGLSPDRQRTVDQIPVPTGYANKVYSFLFMSLLQDQGILAIGLYRARGTLGALTSYVLTNPPKDCIVNPDDLVYIIA